MNCAILFICKVLYTKLIKNLQILLGSVLTLPVNLFFGDGLSFATRGSFYFYTDNYSDAVCITWRIFLQWFEGIQLMLCILIVYYIVDFTIFDRLGTVQWTLVAMNVDRLMALKWPFWARAHITPRVIGLLEIAIILFTFGIALFSINLYGVLLTSSNLVGKSCTGFSKGNLQCWE